MKQFVAFISSAIVFAILGISSAFAFSGGSLWTVLTAANINPVGLQKAIKAYYWAQAQGKLKSKILTFIDFSKPSVQKRLWIIDMTTGRVLVNDLLSHGSGSGLLYARHFSARSGSHASLLGAMVTGSVYQGKHGMSVRVYGLEQGNYSAANRSIVFHSAPYATPEFAKTHGYLGRSWGCFAVNPDHARYIFNTIKNGSFVFAYAPTSVQRS